MLTLRLFFTLGYLFDGEKTFHFFFQQKSSLRSFVKKSLKVFSYLKTSTFWSFWKKVRNECVLKKKKKSKCIWQCWKKSFLKTRGIPFWYPYDTREHHHSLLNVKLPSFLMIQSGRFISDKSNHLKIKLQ